MAESTARGSTTNNVRVSSTTPDPNTGNNTDSDSPTIVGEADLALAKAFVGTGSFIAGQQEQYTFTVTNAGPSADSPTYTITDTLPAGLTFVSASGEATCTSPNGTDITCIGGGIAANAPAQTTTITVNVAPNATGTLNNSATVTTPAGTTDPNPSNNTDNTSVVIEPNTDLTVMKTHTGDFTAGEDETYTITTTNNGPSDVPGYGIYDVLDPNLTFQSSTPANACTVSGQSPQGGEIITCIGGALTGNGAQDVIGITVQVEPTATPGSTISNTAAVDTVNGYNDPNPDNNTSTIDNTVVASADITLTKSHTGDFTVGAQGTFTIDVTNNGPSDASTVTVTDVLPNGLSYVGATSTDAVCDNAGQTVTCTIDPVLSAGQTVSIALTVSVDPDVTAGSFDNTASAASATPDPNTNNNSDTDTVTIDPAEADLTATKTAQGSLTAGAPVTYRFEITNNGPDNAGVVRIEDDLPSYLSYQSFSSVDGSWNCSANGQDVTCTLGVLNNGDTGTVDVTVLVAQDAPTPAENSATISFNGTNTSPNNPTTSDPVDYSADLEAKLTHQSKTYHSGDTVTFTYTAINHGPSAAKDVELKDTLPNGLTFENIVAYGSEPNQSTLSKLANVVMPRASAAPNTPFNCSNSGQDISCTTNILFVGTYTIQMTAHINDNFTGNLTSVLDISSSTPDPNLSNNSSIDTIFDIQPAVVGDGLGRLLANTGQNIFLWVLIALGIIGLAIFFIYKKKQASRR